MILATEMIVQELMRELPSCETKVTITYEQGLNGSAGLGEIRINPRAKDLRHVVHHELGHCFHLRNPHWLKYFGRAPFNTEYALTQPENRLAGEDFAEQFAELYMKGRPRNRKQRLIRRLISSLKS